MFVSGDLSIKKTFPVKQLILYIFMKVINSSDYLYREVYLKTTCNWHLYGVHLLSVTINKPELFKVYVVLCVV